MSLTYNDTTNYKGVVQIYEKEVGLSNGAVSGNTTLLKELTADVNQSLDDFFSIALPASGDWQLDDSNQTSYPIVTANLVQGQRDYPFTTDSDGNLILDIYKVLILPTATATLYQPLGVIDAQSEDWNGIQVNLLTQGVPYQYDKTANGIFLDPIPSYNATSGLKVYINREASYFAYTDTTKKPGVPGLFHRYFAIKPAMEYARRKNLKVYAGLYREVLQMEVAIKAYFGKRDRDAEHRITMEPTVFI